MNSSWFPNPDQGLRELLAIHIISYYANKNWTQPSEICWLFKSHLHHSKDLNEL